MLSIILFSVFALVMCQIQYKNIQKSLSISLFHLSSWMFIYWHWQILTFDLWCSEPGVWAWLHHHGARLWPGLGRVEWRGALSWQHLRSWVTLTLRWQYPDDTDITDYILMIDLPRRLTPGALVVESAQVCWDREYWPQEIFWHNLWSGLNGLEMMCGRLEEETYELIIRWYKYLDYREM